MTHATRHGDTAHNAAEESLLSARGLRLGYGDRTILDGVELTIRSGEFWFLLGPNGHGKTTLLRALLGRLPPMNGQIERRGEFACPACLGFVPQHCALNPTLPTTVREFVGLGLVGIHADKSQRRERLTWALARVGLAGSQHTDYWSLSGGQRQRALVARALVRRPRLLIADEPTSGLDLSVEAILLESLTELNRQERLTLIIVGHDLAVAARYGTHVALIHDGHVHAGPIHEIMTAENLRCAYGVSIAVGHDDSGGVNVRISRGATLG